MVHQNNLCVNFKIDNSDCAQMNLMHIKSHSYGIWVAVLKAFVFHLACPCILTSICSQYM